MSVQLTWGLSVDPCPAIGTVLQNLLFSLPLQALADYASENLEAMNPPLFLRFLNLLMNDAIFLLDEAIQVGLSLHSISITLRSSHFLGTIQTSRTGLACLALPGKSLQ